MYGSGSPRAMMSRSLPTTTHCVTIIDILPSCSPAFFPRRTDSAYQPERDIAGFPGSAREPAWERLTGEVVVPGSRPGGRSAGVRLRASSPQPVLWGFSSIEASESPSAVWALPDCVTKRKTGPIVWHAVACERRFGQVS